MTHTTDSSRTINRREFLVRGTAGLAAGMSLPALLEACGGSTGGGSSSSQLTVVYWTNVTPQQDLQAVFNGFAKQYKVKVNYFQLPQVFGDDVQKLTTYLS